MSSVEPQTPYNEYPNVDGVTTVFPYEFQLLSASDLVVTVNGVVVPSSDFILTGVGVQAGGDITFNTAPLVGSDVLLSRVLVLQRNTDYQYNGDLKENTVDNDFNRLWQALQGIDAVIGGAVRVPFPEQVDALPDATSRANTVLGFDGAGQPTTTIPASGSAADVLLQLANSASASLGPALVAYNAALAYAAGTAGFELNLRKRVIATGVAATDTAAVQAAITAATDYQTIELFGSFAFNAQITLKPMLRLVHARGTITFSGTGRMFDYSPGTPAGYPGRIVLEGFRVNGPGTGGAAEWLHIDANCPFVLVRNCFITNFAKGIYLRDAYCSTIIDTSIDVCQHGIQLYRESHAVAVINGIVNNCTVAALSVNYGGGAGTGVLHNLNLVGGAYQNSATGIWLEQSQGAHITNVYHEGNTGYDIRIGIADAGAYMRSALGTIVDGYESSSPCGAGRNIQLEHAVGTELRGISWNSGVSTTATLLSYDGFSDRTRVQIMRYTTTTPTDTAPINFTASTTRGKIEYGALSLLGAGTTQSYKWGTLATEIARIFQSPMGGGARESLVLSSALDVLARIQTTTGVFRVQDFTGADLLMVDNVNNKINLNKPLDVANQITATAATAGGGTALPATPVGYLQIVIAGVARKLPYFAV